MAYNDQQTIAYGGESQDQQTETLDSIVGTVSVTPSATFTHTGTRSLAFDQTAVNKSLLRGSGNSDWSINGSSGIVVVTFSAALSVAPSAEINVFGGDPSSSGVVAGTNLNARYIRIGTDRKLRLYDKNGNLLYTSTALIPTAAPMREVVVSYDAINAAMCWIKVYFDGVEETAFDSALSFTNMFASGFAYWGDTNNRGCTLYLDDFFMQYSIVDTDALHRTAYPRVLVAGDVTADAQATYSAWLAAPVQNHYLNIQTNDGATTTLSDATPLDADTWKSSTANPMPGGATVIKAQLRQVALIASMAKNPPYMLWGTVGSPIIQSDIIGSVSTTYTARIANRLLNSGFILPVFSDANANTVEWGVRVGETTSNSTITFGPGTEWVYYTATLPLGSAPAASGRRRGGVF